MEASTHLAHALLSPSGASRWLVCTRSARLEQQFQDRSGQAAAEGTLAHDMSHLTMIPYKLGRIRKTEYNKAMKAYPKDSIFQKLPDTAHTEMVGHMENYSDYVLEQFSAAKLHTKDAEIFLETKLDMTDYVPEGFGTGDVFIIADRILDFIDLKYGKGVPVDATDNKQMKLYALGAIKAFSHLYDFHTIRMTIYQPRIDNISVWSITVEELLVWAEEELKPKARMAFDGTGEFVPGSACTFCKAKANCRANSEYQLEVAKFDFALPEVLTEEEIAEVLSKGKELAKWVTAVQKFALLEAVHNGKSFPGYKLVEGRSTRQFTDEIAVAEKLVEIGWKDDEIYKRKLLGITALEGKLTKKGFAEKLGDYVVKPTGSPTLVSEADGRPAIEVTSIDASADFGEDFEDDI